MKKALLLFSILLLPTIVYIFFSLGVPKVSRAPFFGPRHSFQHTDNNGFIKTDTAYFVIPHFHCKTTNDVAFDSKTLGGHLYLAIFVNPDSMKTVLPLLAEDIRTNRGEYQYARFAFFWPVDSSGNVPGDAPDFASDLKLGPDTALSLFVPRATFDTLRDHDYFIADASRKKNPWQSKGDAVLIDRLGRIRGYYNIRYADELKKMKEDTRFIIFHDEAAHTIESSTVEQKRK